MLSINQASIQDQLQFSSQNNNLTACPFSTYFNPYFLQCEDCENSCTNGCTNPDNCILNIDIQCVEATSLQQCTLCKEGSELIDGKCQCINGTSYDMIQNKCLCEGSAWINGGTCQACSIAFCEICENDTICNKCSVGFLEPDCRLQQQCTDANCRYCESGSCEGCKDGYRLDGICQQCTANNCKKCDQDLACCSECLEGYKLESCNCVLPSVQNTNIDCYPLDLTSQTPCTQCPAGEQISWNGQCIACSVDQCKQCNIGDNSKCDVCNIGYRLSLQDTCVLISTKLNCDVSYQNYEFVCSICKEGHIKLYDGSCVPQCPTGYTDEAQCQGTDIYYEYVITGDQMIYSSNNLDFNAQGRPLYMRGQWYEPGQNEIGGLDSVEMIYRNSIQVLVKPLMPGTIICLYDGMGFCNIELSAENDGVKAYFKLLNQDSSVDMLIIESQQNLGQWTLIRVDLDFNQIIGSVYIYAENTQIDSKSFIYKQFDSMNLQKQLRIGAEYSMSASFTGILAGLTIYPFIIPAIDPPAVPPLCMGAHCPISCTNNEYLDQTDLSCKNCPTECTEGCIHPNHCVYNVDQLCKVANSIYDCAECVEQAQFNVSTCECIQNAEYNPLIHQCACSSPYKLEVDTCICPLEGCNICHFDTKVICTECALNYTLVDGSCQLDCLTPNCLQCVEGSTSQCEVCESGYGVNGTTCQPIPCNIQFCAQCNISDPNLCENCEAGYTNFGNLCDVCQIQNCQTCVETNPNACQTCLPGYQLANQAFCEEKQCFVQNCEECGETSQECISCFSGFSLVDSQCSSCIIENCETCEPGNPEFCKLCAPGFRINSIGACEARGVTLPMCLRVNDLIDTICDECIDGYVSVQGSCQQCSVYACKKCTASEIDKCEMCYEQFAIRQQSICQPKTCYSINCLGCREGDPFSCEVCKPGYLEGKDGNCSQCIVENCDNCSSTDPAYCLQCKTGYANLLSTCEKIPCDVDGCSECFRGAPNKCKVCQSGYQLDSELQCTQCIADRCLRCFDYDSTLCVECAVGYQGEGCLEIQCNVPNCAKCNVSDSNVCEQCNIGYGLAQDGSCTICNVEQCRQCTSANSNICKECITGFTGNYTDKCTKISCQIQNCKYCAENDSEKCEVCQPGYFLHSNKTCKSCPIDYCLSCNPDFTCNKCAIGYQLNLINNLCDPISCNVPFCQQCQSDNSDICEVCNDSSVLDQGICSSCTVENCVQCEDGMPDICKECMTGFNGDFTNACTPLECSAPDCSECVIYDPNFCVKCIPNRTLNKGVCEPCLIQDCQECINGNQNSCRICNQGFSMQLGNCIENPCEIADCQKCITGNSKQCEVCNQGKWLLDGQCVDCIVNNCQSCFIGYPEQCLTCDLGYSRTQDFQCVKISCNILNCDVCSDWDPNFCVQCVQQYRLNDKYRCEMDCTDANCGSCSSVDQCQQCKIGYSLTPLMTCQEIPCSVQGCAQCFNSNSSQCNICEKGYAKTSANLCVDCTLENCDHCVQGYPDVCEQCSPGYGFSQQLNCVLCQVPNCVQCYEGQINNCQICSNTYFPDGFGECTQQPIQNCIKPVLNQFNEVVCQECAQQYTLNSQGQCQLCLVQDCVQCIDGDENSCLDCDTGFYLQNSSCNKCTLLNCQDCESAILCTTCQSGYFWDYSLQECVKCVVPNCDTCSPLSKDQCQQCSYGYRLLGYQCALMQCEVSNCSQCQFGSSNICETCQNGYALTNTNQCSSCIIENCISCLPGEPEFCNTCNQFYQKLEDGSCLFNECSVANCHNCVLDEPEVCEICKQGYSNVGGQCTGCAVDNCKLCNAHFSSICNECNDGFTGDFTSQCDEIPCMVDNCLECTDNPMICLKAPPGFGIAENGSAQVCAVSYCEQCSLGKPYTCQTCLQGYQLTAPDTCSQIQCDVKNCLECNPQDSFQCNTCISGQVPYKQTCSSCIIQNCIQCQADSTDQCEICEDGYEGPTCTEIACNVFNCAQCDSQNPDVCEKCNQNYFINGGKCEFCNIEGCDECLSASECTTCGKGYCKECSFGNRRQLQNGCQAIPCNIDNCAQCSIDNPDICEECISQHQLIGTDTCVEIICTLDNCWECSSDNYCKECLAGRQAKNGECVLCAVDNCETCYQNKPDQCMLCGKGYNRAIDFTCESIECYVQFCDQCSDLFSNKCEICSEGYVNSDILACEAICDDPLCKICDQRLPNLCYECIPGYAYISNPICEKIPCTVENCAQCLFNNSIICQTCEQGYGITADGKCSTCTIANCAECPINHPNVCNTCDSGFWLTEELKCSNCEVENCLTCEDYSYSVCKDCRSGYRLLNNQCVPCGMPFCGVCDGLDKCLRCKDGYGLVTDGLGCHQTCPSGFVTGQGMCDRTVGRLEYIFNDKQQIYISQGYSLIRGTAQGEDNQDPWPAYLRGYYFNSSQQMQMTQAYIFDMQFSIQLSLRIQSGSQILCHRLNNQCPLQISFTPENLTVNIPLYDSSTNTNSQLNFQADYSQDQWFILTIMAKTLNGLSTFSIYINSNLMDTSTLENGHLRYYTGGQIILGQQLTGFIASLIIDNGDNISTLSFLNDCLTPEFCLSNCPILQYPTQSGCMECPSQCTKGCMNEINCNLNSIQLCKESQTYSSCGKCVDLANLIDDDCICIENSQYSPVTNLCECQQDYEAIEGQCVLCKPYLNSGSLRSIVFSNSLNGITLTFTVSIVIEGLEDCQAIFTQETYAKLGESPICTWESTKILRVTFGKGALLVNEGVNIDTQKVLADISSCSFKYTQVSLEAVFSVAPTEPVIQVIYPSVFSVSCSSSDIFINASSSQGPGQLFYKWTLQSQGFDQLTDFVNNSTSAVLTIPFSELQIGDLQINLQVSSRFGTISEEMIDITVTNDRVLGIELSTGKEAEFYLAKDNQIIATITGFCSEGNVTYEWSIQQTPDSELTIDMLKPLGNILQIPKHVLKPELTYTFGISAVQEDGSQGSAQVQVTTIRSKLRAKLDRSSSDVSNIMDFTISGSDSEDPDNPETELTYTWECRENDNFSPCETKQDSLLELPSSPTITIPSRSIPNYTTWNIYLKITSPDTREAQASATFNFKSMGFTEIKLQAPEGKISANQQFVATAEVISDEGTVISWNQTAGKPLGLQFDNTNQLVIPGDVLQPGEVYQITLDVDNPGYIFPLSQSLSIRVNVGPVATGLRVTPESGDVNTSFRFQVEDPEDGDLEDYPLTFAFGIQGDSFEGTFSLLQSEINYLELTLFPQVHTATCEICDSLLACMTLSSNLQVVNLRQLQELSDQEIIQSFDNKSRMVNLIPLYTLGFSYSYQLQDHSFTYIKDKFDEFFSQLQYYDSRTLKLKAQTQIALTNQRHLMNSDRVLGAQQQLQSDVLNTTGIYFNEIYPLMFKFYKENRQIVKDTDQYQDLQDLFQMTLLDIFLATYPQYLPEKEVIIENDYAVKVLGKNFQDVQITLDNIIIKFPDDMGDHDVSILDFAFLPVQPGKDEILKFEGIFLKSGFYDRKAFKLTYLDKGEQAELQKDPIQIQINLTRETNEKLFTPGLVCITLGKCEIVEITSAKIIINTFTLGNLVIRPGQPPDANEAESVKPLQPETEEDCESCNYPIVAFSLCIGALSVGCIVIFIYGRVQKKRRFIRSFWPRDQSSPYYKRARMQQLFVQYTEAGEQQTPSIYELVPQLFEEKKLIWKFLEQHITFCILCPKKQKLKWYGLILSICNISVAYIILGVIIVCLNESTEADDMISITEAFDRYSLDDFGRVVLSAVFASPVSLFGIWILFERVHGRRKRKYWLIGFVLLTWFCFGMVFVIMDEMCCEANGAWAAGMLFVWLVEVFFMETWIALMRFFVKF